jgi:DNA-binding XRE family transcriptional regulator
MTDGFAEIALIVKVPAAKAAGIEKALERLLAAVEQAVGLRAFGGYGGDEKLVSEKSVSIEEAFPDGHAGMLIRGLRGKNDMTQEELAKRLGVAQTRVSELEIGKRSVSAAMAKRLASVFNVAYKMFL